MFTKYNPCPLQHTISTSVIQFATLVTLLDIYLGKIANTGNLNVFGGLDEVNTFQGTGREDSSTTTFFGAVSNLNTFGITDVSRGCCRYLWACTHLYECKINTNEGPRDKSHPLDCIGQLVLYVHKIWRVYVLKNEILTFLVITRTGSTIICTVLTVLRGLREVINGVARIPDLVDTTIAPPNLNLNKVSCFKRINTRGKTSTYGIAIFLISTRKINAFAISPFQTVIALRLFRNRMSCIKSCNLPYTKIFGWNCREYNSISEVLSRLLCCHLLRLSICSQRL